jgi:hypothetical protein
MAQIQLVRAALASEYGTKPVPFMLTDDLGFSSTVTTGIVNTPAKLLVTDFDEFSTLALLFDEYKYHEGTYRFMVITPTNTAILGTSTLTTGAMLAIGFDPSDNTALTSTQTVCQLQYHELLSPRMLDAFSVGQYAGVYGREDCRPFTLHWSIKGDYLTGDGGATGPGMWKSTQGNVSSFPDGNIKTYYASGETTAKLSITGIVFGRVLFRCRT